MFPVMDSQKLAKKMPDAINENETIPRSKEQCRLLNSILLPITKQEVMEKISLIKDKNSGWNKDWSLKNIKHLVADPLTYILNKGIQKEIFPEIS